MGNNVWRVSLVFLAATKKKEVVETVDFASKAAAEAALAAIDNDPDRKAIKMFKITNDVGELVNFTGGHLLRHTLKRCPALD